MKKNTLTFLSLVLLQLFLFGQKEIKTNDVKTIVLNKDSFSLHNNNSKLELPKINSKDIFIEHTGYSLSYNETHKQANWVAYDLKKEETNKMFERSNKFIPDLK